METSQNDGAAHSKLQRRDCGDASIPPDCGPTAAVVCIACDADDGLILAEQSQGLSPQSAASGFLPTPPGDVDVRARRRRTDAVLVLKEWALESFERQLRAHRRGAGTTVLHMDGRARHARRERGDG